MTTISYKVVLVRTDMDETKKLFTDLDESFRIAKGAYATEVSLLTHEAEKLFKIGQTNEPETYCIAFDDKNNVLGFILLEADQRTMTLWTCHVYVRPEVRGQGIYKLMMERVRKFAKDAGFSRVFSIVHTKNQVSKIAHKKTGWQRQWIGYEINLENANDNQKNN